MFRRLVRRAGVASTLVLPGFAWSLAGPPPAAQAAEGRIVFARGSGEVWSINGDGKGLRRLVKTRAGPVGLLPRLSPDGRRLLYWTSREGLVFADGAGRTPRRAPGLGCCDPAWSPDGKWLAFADRSTSLVVVEASGRQRRTVLRLPFDPSATSTTLPSWSPGGQAVAVGVHVTEAQGAPDPPQNDIWVARPDGRGARNFTRTPPSSREVPCGAEEPECSFSPMTRRDCDPRGAEESAPIWTPAGIVIQRDVCVPLTVPCSLRPELSCRTSTIRRTLSLLGADGQPVRDLFGDTGLTASFCGGSLSPDRRKIAVTSGGALHVIALAGGPPRRLVTRVGCAPTWGEEIRRR